VLFLLASGPIASALAKEKQADSAEVVSSGEDEKTVSWGGGFTRLDDPLRVNVGSPQINISSAARDMFVISSPGFPSTRRTARTWPATRRR